MKQARAIVMKLGGYRYFFKQECHNFVENFNFANKIQMIDN